MFSIAARMAFFCRTSAMRGKQQQPLRPPNMAAAVAAMPAPHARRATTIAEHLKASAERTVVIAQIEDVEALDEVDAIAAVPGIDMLFAGRMDLTVALGASSADAPEVITAVQKICDAARSAGRPLGMFVPRNSDVPQWRAAGATLFLQGSDHSFMRAGAISARRDTAL
jgi:2-keto-3-deoxy-L-rhamnonate aldolase RhmA